MYFLWYFFNEGEPIFIARFFRSASGREPVREWLKRLDKVDRKSIGEDIKLLQFRWPLGMPLVRKFEPDLGEMHTRISDHRTIRLFFTVGETEIVLLHGFIKKSQKTPPGALKIARDRKGIWIKGEKDEAR